MSGVPGLRDIVKRVGGELVNGGREARVPGPGHSRRDRSLSLRSAADGRVLFHDFTGNHSVGEIRAHLGLSSGEGYQPTSAEARAAKRLRDAEAAALLAEKHAFCEQVWSQTVEPAGTVVSAYLGARLLLSSELSLVCPDIRFSPAAPRAVPWNRMKDDPPPPPPHPAMVCLARDHLGRAQGLHLTYLDSQGRKAFGSRSRIMIGSMTGASLQLAPISPDGTLAVGEGMETARGFTLLRGVPTWATFSTSGLRNFVVPRGVRRLIIAADNDANGAGFAAAADLAERARSTCDVEIEVPTAVGDDWADVWSRRA